MCRNIKTLYHFAPPASEEEVRAAALQYVRKVSGFRQPSRANEAAFQAAVDAVAGATEALLSALKSDAPLKDRAIEVERARERSRRRFARPDTRSTEVTR